MKYALLSVSDKQNIVELAKKLIDLGYTLISTGGTGKVLEASGVVYRPIQEITGNPESFDGRMKTISFQIESGILFDRSNPSHVDEAKQLKVPEIGVVVCNLYPFEQTVKTLSLFPSPSGGGEGGGALETAIESIDVGGPTMIRAAAKNFKHVIVVTDSKDYHRVAEALEAGLVDQKFRQELATKAFWHLSFYDSQVASYLNKTQSSPNIFPEEITLPGRKQTDLRYGENPHQLAATYASPNILAPINSLKQLAGRGLSLTNVSDINAGLEVVRLFREAAAVVIKHNNPCGIALGGSPAEALGRAIEADAESAFGGVIVLNREMDEATAKVIANFKDESHGNIDIIAVPQVSDGIVESLSAIRKTMGIYSFGTIPPLTPPVSPPLKGGDRGGRLNFKWLDGGFILQTADDDIEQGFTKWDIVAEKQPSDLQLAQMKIAWNFITRIRSNAIIVLDKDLPMTRGIGTGQTSRVRSVKIALEQAGNLAKGAILASDSFFPFPDSVKLAAAAGISAIVQQGDSINDKASIIAANEAGLTMVFTHRRAFWH